VGVNGGTASVNVTFAANSATSAKTYTVSVAAGSTKIKGSTTVNITQAAAGSATTTIVNLLNLSGLVIAPVKDNAPGTTAIDTAQYTGIIEWYTGGGLAFNDPTFAANTVYKALVTLSAKPNYTFTGVSENNFIHMGASSVANGANSGTVTITFPATGNVAATVVSAFNLTGLVIAPVKDNTPGTLPIEATQYTGSIAWYTDVNAPISGGTFAAATVYKAVVTLSAQSGYTFTGVSADSFTHTGATTVSNIENSGTVTITFPETADAVVNALNLSSLLTAPVRGNAPVTTAINETQYTGSIEWQTSGGSAFSGGTFAAATVYKALVTLSAKSGYTFTGVLQNSFSYTNATTVSNGANSGTVTITFPATAAEVVNALNLSSLLTAPVKGNAPVTTAINETQYTGNIEWQTSSGSAFSGGTFAAATVYKALVTITVNSGYTFPGVLDNSFSYTNATTVSNGANSGTVTITFPATADAVVNALNLSSLVTAPVKGAAPGTMPINETQYTGSIAWYTGAGSAFSSSTFAAATVYKAIVTLSAKSGYTFSGVSQNGFTYTNATGVTNTENSGTVTITFPATANETGGIGVNFGGLPQDETIGLTVPAATLSWVANTTLTVSVGDTFSAYMWYVDGVVLPGAIENSVSLTAQNYSLGRHNVSVRVRTAGGAFYSKTAHFTITQ
jgi:hypothetical protein